MRFEFLHRRVTRVLASQVHDCAGEDAPRHRNFLAGAGAVAGLSWLVLSNRLLQAPPLLDERLVTGALSAPTTAPTVLLWSATAFVPIALAIFVSRTGKLREARIAAAICAGCLTLGLAVSADFLALGPAVVFGALLVGAGKPERADGLDEPSVSAVPDTKLLTRHEPDGSVRSASPAVGTLLHRSTHELEGDGFFSCLHVADRVTFRKALDDAIASGTSTSCELRLFTAAGRTVWIETTCIAASGEIVCASRDVSASHEHAEALQLAACEAEELSRAKSRFIAVASHELRTPLNAIIGFSDLLRTLDRADADLPYARRREYADLIHGAGHHLLEVVNDLLDMSRIEAGRYELCLDTVDMKATIARCLSMLSVMADERGVRLANIADRNLPELEADPRACRQMLINLVSNAVRFAPAGSTVTVGASSENGAMVLRVCDSGDGMSSDDVARLGTPFTQVGDGRDGHARASEGTGLGLSIVKGLVELHGGTFAVRSKPAPSPGHGTEVILSIPLEHQPQVEAPRVVALHPRSTAEGPKNRSNEYGRVSA